MKNILFLLIAFLTAIISCKKDSQLVYDGPPVANNHAFLLDKKGWIQTESRSCLVLNANNPQSWTQEPFECFRYYFKPDYDGSNYRIGITERIFDCNNHVVFDTLTWKYLTYGSVKKVELKVKKPWGETITITWNVDSISANRLVWSRNSFGDSLVSVYEH